jgi:uncharacterized RDD family membrane protein YckC
MKWFYSNKGQRMGPVSQSEFDQLVHDGVILENTLVWREGMADWRPYSSIGPEGNPPSGQFVYAGFWLRFCAKFIDGLVIGIVSTPVNMLLAFLILGSPNFFGPAFLLHSAHDRLVFQAVSLPVGIGIAIGYACFFILRWDATPGKMALGLKLVRSNGDRLSAGRIAGRYFSEWLSAIIFCIGYLMVIGDSEKRALHDRICDTRVIRAK